MCGSPKNTGCLTICETPCMNDESICLWLSHKHMDSSFMIRNTWNRNNGSIHYDTKCACRKYLQSVICILDLAVKYKIWYGRRKLRFLWSTVPTLKQLEQAVQFTLTTRRGSTPNKSSPSSKSQIDYQVE